MISSNSSYELGHVGPPADTKFPNCKAAAARVRGVDQTMIVDFGLYYIIKERGCPRWTRKEYVNALKRVDACDRGKSVLQQRKGDTKQTLSISII
jgi:hypothetical protein